MDCRGKSSKRRGRPAGAFPLVLTVGHSTRAIGDFIRLLQTHGVTCVVDVRTIPRSRHNPQFNKESLPGALKDAGIDYTHLAGLGGLRQTTGASVNMGWRNTSFRGFADYMLTDEFEQALQELIQLLKRKQEHIVLMCAEAVPWRCHRSLIADALLVRKIPVEHIMSLTRRQIHALTPFASVRGTRITYPAVAVTGTDRPRAHKAGAT
jgi:uncharacterized protein (DUF488 family)